MLKYKHMIKHKLMESDGQGYFNVHTDGLDKNDANEMLKRYSSTFPQYDYYIEEYNDKPKRQRYYNNKAVDGWEDIYRH